MHRLWQKMSPGQFKRYALDDFLRLEDESDDFLAEWVPTLVKDGETTITVGLWRCPSGEIRCDQGWCDDECGCCDNDYLWESPITATGIWDVTCPECDRKALLVEVVGPYDFSEVLAGT